MKFILIIFSSVILFSCGPTKDLILQNVNKKGYTIDGVFENSTNKKDMIKLLDRSSLLSDTLRDKDLSNYDKFSISTIDDTHLKISIISAKDPILTREYKYKKQNDIYYLSNKNIKPFLIPYLFGSIDEKRLYLYINDDNNLEINVYESTSGAIFFVGFLDGGSRLYNYQYKRIK